MRTGRLALVAVSVIVVGVSIGWGGGERPEAVRCQSGTENDGRMTVYISPNTPQQFRGLAGYTLADGCPAVDIAAVFAANYAGADRPYLRANNNSPPTRKPFNENIQQVLDDGSVQYLQDKGIRVLLSVTNGHHPVGWSQFTSEDEARDFVKYLKTDVVDKYGLDGIDIDDEYSSGRPNDTSLIMVTTLMRKLMPDKIISKALFQDFRYFQANWKGHTLAKNLDYAWEMSYGGYPLPRLSPYVRWFDKNQLSLGFWSGAPSRAPSQNVHWLLDNGYAGIMLFAFQDEPNVKLMGDLINDWYGPGNWNPPTAD
jgi:hypothetical protein